MKQKGAHLQEILSRPGRTTVDLANDLRLLSEQWGELDGKLGMFAEFVPIKIVNIFECILKASVKHLVDARLAYSRNSSEFLKELNGRDIIDAIHHAEHRTSTVGDIVAFTVRCNGINDIELYLGRVIGKNFKDELAKTAESWIEDDTIRMPIIRDVEVTFVTLHEIFTIRNILVHENPSKPIFDAKRIPDMLSHSIVFAHALCWLISNDLDGPRVSKMIDQKDA